MMTTAVYAVRIAALSLLWLGLAACARQEVAAPAVATTNAAWTGFVVSYVEETFKAQPMFAVQQGRHEFDGRMPDLSRDGIAVETRRLQSARATAQAFASESLESSQRFERDYLLAEIDSELFWLDKAPAPFRNPAWYVNQLDPEVYLSREYASLQQRLPGYIGYAQAIPGIVADIEANLRTPLPRSFVEYAVRAFGGFADFYASEVPRVFAAVTDVAAQKQLATANAAAIRAMRELRDWFVAQRKGANEDYALGAEVYAAMLRDTDSVDMPVAAIKAAGEADIARNTVMLKEACAAFAPGQDIPACVAKVGVRKSPGGPVAGARAKLDELRAFVRQQDLVTVPSDEQAAVAESPPYNRGNSAYIIIPGPYEKKVASVYSITPPDPSWSRKEQLEYVQGEAPLLNTTVHEVWPGHFQQFLHSNRVPSIVGRLYVGYDFAEGWAHYAEELMWDAGLGAGNPENHIAQLTDALWRDVRLLSSIGLHTEGMTVEQSEKLFRDVAFKDAGTARQQAARGTYDPAYLNYTLGKLQILKLREDWIARQRAAGADSEPRQYWKAFHDQFLSYGGPPIPLVRRAMLPDDRGPLL
jgi:hypothetical protein